MLPRVLDLCCHLRFWGFRSQPVLSTPRRSKLPCPLQVGGKRGERYYERQRLAAQGHSAVTGVPSGRAIVHRIDYEPNAADLSRSAQAAPRSCGEDLAADMSFMEALTALTERYGPRDSSGAAKMTPIAAASQAAGCRVRPRIGMRRVVE